MTDEMQERQVESADLERVIVVRAYQLQIACIEVCHGGASEEAGGGAGVLLEWLRCSESVRVWWSSSIALCGCMRH